jgi:hypothetical protein
MSVSVATATPSAADAPLAPPSSPPPPPSSTGPSRETLCEKALFDLERAAAPMIDRCIGPRPSSQQPIAVNVAINEQGRIGSSSWDSSTTTGYGEKAAKCILAGMMTLPFDEPACAKETLQVRRAVGQPMPDVFNSRF